MCLTSLSQVPKPVCQHQDRRSKASSVVSGLQNSGCPRTRRLCHLIKTDWRAPEAAGNAPGTDQTDQCPGWTQSEWELQQACKLSVMIRVFAKCDDQCNDQCVCHVSFLFHFSS